MNQASQNRPTFNQGSTSGPVTHSALQNETNVQQIFCILGGAVCCLVGVLIVITDMAMRWGLSIGGLLFSAPFLAGMFFLFRRFSRLRRADSYKRALAGWEGCTLKELAHVTGSAPDKMKQNVKMLIQKGYLSGALLDEQNEILFANQAAYQEYQKQHSAPVQASAPAKEKAAAPKTAEEPGFVGVANRFLKQAKKLEPEVDDLEARRQVQILQEHVAQIRDWVKQHPGSENRVKRLETYYLPTALKLLDTYVSVDNRPGATAQDICGNITGIFATFNSALLKMQDTMLDDTALDVSAEISALESMLKQEGLTETDFTLAAELGKEE